jgi:hypothetical protein
LHVRSVLLPLLEGAPVNRAAEKRDHEGILGQRHRVGDGAW